MLLKKVMFQALGKEVYYSESLLVMNFVLA